MNHPLMSSERVGEASSNRTAMAKNDVRIRPPGSGRGQVPAAAHIQNGANRAIISPGRKRGRRFPTRRAGGRRRRRLVRAPSDLLGPQGLATMSISAGLARREGGSRRGRLPDPAKGAVMSTNSKSTRIALWVVQGILAALFLFAGGFKLAAPAAELSRVAAPLSGGFLKFIGVCEVLGGLGLVLPGLFRIRL